MELTLHSYRILLNQITFLPNQDAVIKNCQTPYKRHPKGCPSFGMNWSCPPYAPKINETYDILSTYPKIWIITFELPLDGLKRKILPQKLLISKKYKNLTNHFNRFLAFLQNHHPEWQIYFCSQCQLCQERVNRKCSCPTSPCRFPKEIRISPEAAGIDIFTTLNNINHQIEDNPQSKIQRVAMCASDENIEFKKEYSKFQHYLNIYQRIQN